VNLKGILKDWVKEEVQNGIKNKLEIQKKEFKIKLKTNFDELDNSQNSS